MRMRRFELAEKESPREYSSPGGEAEDEWFVDILTGTINIGASLEDATWDLALRVLPQAWWDRRTAELAAAARTRRPIPAQNAATDNHVEAGLG